MAEETAAASEAADVNEEETQALPRAQILKQLIEQEGMTPEVAAYADVFGIPVAIELKHPIALCVPDQSRRTPSPQLGVPAVRRAKDGEVMQADLLDSSFFDAPVTMGANNTGQRLLIVIPTPEGAALQISVDPADVRYVTRVFNFPRESLIHRPG